MTLDEYREKLKKILTSKITLSEKIKLSHHLNKKYMEELKK
jgi:hypothetical protein